MKNNYQKVKLELHALKLKMDKGCKYNYLNNMLVGAGRRIENEQQKLKLIEKMLVGACE